MENLGGIGRCALAYLDDDEKRTRRLLERYASRLDKESPAYEEIQELKKDVYN